jgi:hypothetical protein
MHYLTQVELSHELILEARDLATRTTAAIKEFEAIREKAQQTRSKVLLLRSLGLNPAAADFVDSLDPDCFH